MVNSNHIDCMASSSSYSSASSPSSLLPPNSSHQNSIPSKRDKRRNLLSDHLVHLSASFERDKEIHCRSQVAALRQDLNAIAEEDISGRNMRMLDDGAEGISNSVISGRGAANAPSPNIRGHEISAEGVQPGTFYAGFVAEVNERMEERDVALAMLHRQYHSKIGAIKAQHERSIHHTRQEHINLAVTMKQRLINRLYNAKKKLSIDKEHLDISDSHASLLHPNQFSIGSAATGILGSPSRSDIDRSGDNHGSAGTINCSSGISGGGRRKLRQRKNELEDLVMMGPGGVFDGFGRNTDRDGEVGDAKNATVQKRKARASRASRRMNGGLMDEEEEHALADVFGSSGVTDGDGSNNGSNSTIGQFNHFFQLSQKQKQTQNRNGHGQVVATRLSQPQEMLHKQVYSIEKLFTEKELQMAGNLAALATVKYFLKPKERAERARRGDVRDDDGGEGATEDSDTGTKTPREEVDPKVGISNPDTPTITATGGGQSNRPQGKGITNVNSSCPPDMSCLTPAALFSSVITSTNHSRSSNSSLSTHAVPLINPTPLGAQPPPSLSTLNFMTPTSTGYGAPVWQSLGVPASYFSAGSGSVVNITTTKMMALSAPCPASAKSEEAEDDLEKIKSGKGMSTRSIGVHISGVGEGPEERVLTSKVGRSGEVAKDRERGRRGGDSRDKEKHKEKAREDFPPSTPLRQIKEKMSVFDTKMDSQAKEGEIGNTGPSSVSNENPHGVKRRASSGIAGGVEKRVRKEVRKERENKEKEKDRIKQRDKEKEAVPRAGEEGDAQNGS